MTERRRSDDRMVKVLLVAMFGFAVLFGYGQWAERGARIDAEERSRVAVQDRAAVQDKLDVQQTKLDAQQRDLACFADSTTRWEVAISGVIVSSVREGAVTPERQQQALDELVRVNAELQASKALCPVVGDPSK